MRRVARCLGLVVVLGGSIALGAEGSGPVVASGFAPDPGGTPAPGHPAATAAAPAGPGSRAALLPLGSGGRSRGEPARPAGGLPAAVTVAGSLAVVLGLFLLVAWAMRRATPRGSALLPSEVFEVLGRAHLAGRQQAHLLRCGRKLLLVSVTPAGIETLTEVTEPLEVDRLAGLCRQAQPHGATAAFRQIFQQWAPRNPSQPLPERREPEAVGRAPATRPGDRRWEDDDA
jgi:flagellar biogenesis protein FliO